MMKALHFSTTTATAILLLTAGCSGDDTFGTSVDASVDRSSDGGSSTADPIATPPTGFWVRSVEGVGAEGVSTLVAHPDGTFAVLGSYEGPGTFSPGRPDEKVLAEPAGAREEFLAQYAPDGNLRALRADPLGAASGRVQLTAGGGFYVAGSGGFTAGAVTAPGDADVFVAKYDADATALWASSASGAAGMGAVSALAVSPDGGVVIGGTIEGTLTFGAGQATETRLAANGKEIFLARYAADGALLWAKRAIAAPYLPDWKLAAAADGGIALYGTLENVTTFNPDLGDETKLQGGNIGFIVKLDDAGSVAWARSFDTSEGTSGVSSLTTFPDGDVVVTGSFTRSLTLGPGEPRQAVLAADGSEFPGRMQFPDFFAARFAADGTLSWARREGGGVWDTGGQVEALKDGATLVTGSYTNDVTFAAGEPAATTLSTETNEMSPFVAILDADGELRWVRAGLDGQATQLADGSIAFAGTFMGTTTLFPGEPGETTLASAGGWDVYVARLGW